MPYEDFLEDYKPVKKKVFVNGNFLIKKTSPIHGKGIFTTQKIHADKAFYLVPMNDIRHSPSLGVLKIFNNLFVSDEIVLNFVNHSCDANSIIVFENNQIFLKSTREIAEGEEITLDYYLTEEKNNLLQCNCKSVKCRNYFFIS